MDPKYLVQLAVIVELGSVTKAAQKLNVTQPTLSRSVKIIEDRVGGAVLRRGRYGVTPTDIGTRLAHEGRAILRQSERARSAIQEWKHGLTGEVRIGVGPMLATTIMGDFFAQAVADPPSYRMQVLCEYAARLVDRLHNDQVDVAIIPHELSRNEETLIREELFQDWLSVFVGRDDPLAGKSGVSPLDLAQHHWISVGEISGLFDTTRETLDQWGLTDVTPMLENTGDVTMTFRMLETTKSCSVLPYRQLCAFQDRFHVAPVYMDVELPARNVSVWTSAQGRDKPEIVDFLTRLRTYIRQIGLSQRTDSGGMT